MQCPLCGVAEVTRVFARAELLVKLDSEATRVSGIRAYQCKQAHLFFVRNADVGDETGER